MKACTERRPQNPSLRGRSMLAGRASRALVLCHLGTGCLALAAPSPMLPSYPLLFMPCHAYTSCSLYPVALGHLTLVPSWKLC